MTEQRRISDAELHAFVDGELTSEDRAEIEALLAASPPDLAAARELAELNEAMRSRYAHLLSEPLPPIVQRGLGRLERGRLRLDVPWRLIAAAILIAAVAATGGYLVRGLHGDPRQPDAAFVATAIGAHTVYVPEVRHPVEVGAAEEAHLVQWLTKRIGAEVRAPMLATLGWKLVGGRLLPDHGLPAAQFMYEDPGGQRLTLYIRKEPGLDNTSFQFSERDGFGAFYWIDRPLAYGLAGRLSRAELMALANAVYAQLEAAGGAKKPEQPRP